MASSVAAPARDKASFEKWIKAALAVDLDRVPELRLANLIAQKRARVLLGRMAALGLR
jgi:predicted anti-sigma-YlaC factor YlaD